MKLSVKNYAMNLLSAFVLLALFSFDVAAQSVNRKMGKPTAEELNMTVYDADSSAVAVVLYKESYVSYDWGRDDFQVTYNFKRRIKILKEEGVEYANGTIVYIDKKDKSLLKEHVYGLKASAYNLENGKVVRIKMKDENVFTERVTDNVMQMKYAVPQAKVGSVVEVEYKIVSDYFFKPRDWFAQEEIPVRYAELEMLIPEFISFNIENHGAALLNVTSTPSNQNMSIGGGLVACSSEERKYVGEYLPAIKDEEYVWCPQDYLTQVNMEFNGYDIPGVIHQSYSGSWDQVDKTLFDDSDFGGRMKASNPLREEMEALCLDTLPTVERKVVAIYGLLKSRVKWNGKYALTGNNFRQVLKDGTGDNADINFILMSMLKDAGISSYPVVMSRRDERALPYSHPSIDRLSTFVVGVLENETTLMFIDASVEHGYVNVLPPLLMTSRARLMMPGNCQWINLQQLGSHMLSRTIQASLSAEGAIEGLVSTYYYGIEAADKREGYFAAKDSADYVKAIEDENSINITEYNSFSMKDFTPVVRDVLKFTKSTDVNGDYIYVNPMLFAHVEASPFVNEKRDLPVEFPNQTQYTVKVVLDIPEGYVVEDKPESCNIKMSDGGLSLLYNIVHQGNKLMLKYSFNLGNMMYLPSDYQELKWFWDLVAEKNNAMLVLKKQ